MNNKKYWEEYYNSHREPYDSSLFAKFVLPNLKKGDRLIELGCGNGRDAVFFSKHDIAVTAVDQCIEEVNFLNKQYQNENLKFAAGDFTRLDANTKYDAIYSRFTIHSINREAEDRVLNWARKALNENGQLFIEVRGIHDALYGEGEKVGEHEFVTTHYRRFIVFDDFIEKLKTLGFTLVYSKEDSGFAPHTSEDPICIRVIAK